MHELEPLNLDYYKDRLQTNGVMFALAHGDDESLFAQTARDLLDKNIPVTLFFATHGEQGIPQHMRGTTPPEMAAIREEEIMKAARHLGVTAYMASFSDSRVQFSWQQLQIELAYLTRYVKPAVIASFHPQEITHLFDHLDHTEIGQAARWASQTADMKYHFEEWNDLDTIIDFAKYPVAATWSDQPVNVAELFGGGRPPAMEFRPGLLLWTTTAGENKKFRTISRETSQWRNEYLATFHKSQFPRESMETWKQYFDTLYYKIDGDPVELYKFVR